MPSWTTNVPGSRADVRRAVWRANLRKEWSIHRSLLIDYGVVAVVFVTVLPLDRAAGFIVLGSLLAASLGARIGGAEAQWGTREFVLTRPVTRREWTWIRFSLGLLPLLLALAFFLVADVLDVHRRFGEWLAEGLGGDVPPRLRLSSYVPAAATCLLVHTLAFGGAAREQRPDRVLAHRDGGLVLGVALALVAWVVASLVLRSGLGWIALPREPGVDSDAMALAVGALVLMAVPFAYRRARLSVERLEVTGDESASVAPAGAAGAGGAGVLAVIVVLLLLCAVAYFLVLAPRAVEVVPR